MSRKSKLKACEPVSVVHAGFPTVMDMRDWPAPVTRPMNGMELDRGHARACVPWPGGALMLPPGLGRGWAVASNQERGESLERVLRQSAARLVAGLLGGGWWEAWRLLAACRRVWQAEGGLHWRMLKGMIAAEVARLVETDGCAVRWRWAGKAGAAPLLWVCGLKVENGEMENGEMVRSGGEKPDERQAVLGI